MNFLYPCDPGIAVTQWFGENPDDYPLTKGHNGIDWGTPMNTLLYAAQIGVVSKVGSDPTGYGDHVRIDHGNGWLTIYGHMSQIFVAVGEELRAGELIGKSGNTGRSTGPHVHFEVRKNNIAQNPKPLLVEYIKSDTPDPEFPALPEARVIVPILNVRALPNKQARLMGSVKEKDKLPVMAAQEKDGQKWVKIGYSHWVCMTMNGDDYMEWIK